MSDVADKVNRMEGVQQGLSDYLPLLLNRFENIERELRADLSSTRQELKADLSSTRQELRATEQKIEADLKATEQKIGADLNATNQKLESKLNDIRTEARGYSRTIIMSVVGTGLAIAASIYFT